MSEQGISRRSLLEMGAAAALVAGVSLMGCAPKSSEETAEQTSPVNSKSSADTITWNKEVDVVVVGYGGAGGAAAIEAKRAGSEVLVLEELDQPGGATLACGGSILMANTPLQKKFGLTDSTQAFYDYLCAAGGSTANQDAIKVLCDYSPQLYEWCVECGMEFEKGELYPGPHINSFKKTGYTLFYTGNEQAREFAEITPPVPRGHSSLPSSSGKDIFSALQKTTESLGIEVMTKTPGKHLITNDQGRVVGIMAGEKADIAIKARKAVILTAGGFVNNDDMMSKYYPYPNKRGAGVISAGNENGSGILMGQKIGADTYGIGCFQIAKALSTMSDVLPRGILVNEAGHRIVAEDEYNSYIGKAIVLSPTSKCYMIFDEQSEADENTTKFLMKPLASGNIEEIAQAVGMQADVLKETFAFYNESVALGEDREFGKDPRFLTSYDSGPFYLHACGSESCIVGTCGGLKIDTNAHVLDLNGESIPGLYAAGRNSGSIFGWYMGSGASIADVLTFGGIAGRNAAAESIA